MTNKRDFVDGVLEFNRAAGRPEQFDARQVALHTGLQIEELAEKLDAIYKGAYNEYMKLNAWQLKHYVKELQALSAQFKKGAYDDLVTNASRVDLLDADIDICAVSVGSMMTSGADVKGAMGEVNRSNLDKLVDGKAVFDENKKIQKPAGWRAPNLAPYIGS